MARRCSECQFCRRRGQTKTSRSVIGRRKYYCAHPDRFELPLSVFREMDVGFIGLGEPTPESRLTIKTHPRWCPIEIFHDK